MGFFFRKSAKFGPFRINFSKSGVGLSTGVKGARISTGPKGTFLNLGRGGFYFREKLNKKNKSISSTNKTQSSGNPFLGWIFIVIVFIIICIMIGKNSVPDAKTISKQGTSYPAKTKQPSPVTSVVKLPDSAKKIISPNKEIASVEIPPAPTVPNAMPSEPQKSEQEITAERKAIIKKKLIEECAFKNYQPGDHVEFRVDKKINISGKLLDLSDKGLQVEVADGAIIFFLKTRLTPDSLMKFYSKEYEEYINSETEERYIVEIESLKKKAQEALNQESPSEKTISIEDKEEVASDKAATSSVPYTSGSYYSSGNGRLNSPRLRSGGGGSHQSGYSSGGGHAIQTGPRGGRYYTNSNGNKTYIKR